MSSTSLLMLIAAIIAVSFFVPITMSVVDLLHLNHDDKSISRKVESYISVDELINLEAIVSIR
jgi:hypothetical protein